MADILNIPSRRAALSGIAAVTLAPAVVAAEATSELDSLISRHKGANAAFEAAVARRASIENSAPAGDVEFLRRIWSSSEFLHAEAKQTEASNAEGETRQDLISYPCKSPDEVRSKLEYLASVPLIMETSDAEDFPSLIRSLLGRSAG